MINMTYTIDFQPCTASAETVTATSMSAALRICRVRLGRIYRGAEYRTDRPSTTDPGRLHKTAYGWTPSMWGHWSDERKAAYMDGYRGVPFTEKVVA